MTTPKMCRIAVVVDNAKQFAKEAGEVLGLPFIAPALDAEFPAINVLFHEHGLEPIEVVEPVPFVGKGRLIEVAIDVSDAEATKKLFQAAGYEPIVNNFLPAPAAYEYLFGPDFHGVPIMVCRAGDNEKQMEVDMPFRALDDAPTPKIGCVTLAVKNMDQVAADLGKLLDMTFVATDPAGLGERALVGKHRVKLVENPSADIAKHFQDPLASIDFMYDDVEPVKDRLVKAGYPVVLTRKLKSGGHQYYFGSAFQHMPLSIYPASADAEIIGQA